ncbi:hypothetical protein SAMN05443246_5599 [Paenibacillus sp. GP183]|nr:hypothetical protein SAMN05443246_5599 [Paenibacillus sp. GP183]
MNAQKLEKSSFFVFMSQLLCRDETHKCGDIVLKRHKLGDIVAIADRMAFRSMCKRQIRNSEAKRRQGIGIYFCKETFKKNVF